MINTRLALTVSVFAMGVCLAPNTNAQEESQSKSLEKRTHQILEEVVVTATKRSQSQQDVGITVAAFSGDKMRELGINDAKGIINLVPGTGISDPSGGGVPVIIIRGVGLQNFRINDTPTTAIYVDEVYQTSVAEAAATIFDVERVEVLKGPQGGLYGRNAVGGAIQVISAKPNFEEFEGYASVSFEEHNRLEGEVVLSGPISDELAFRVGGKVINGGGYFHNVTRNSDYGDADRLAGKMLLEWRPNDNINVLFKLHGGKDQSELPLGRAIGVYQPLGLGLGAAFGILNTADAAILNVNSATASISNFCTAVLEGTRSPNSCETLNGMTTNELGISSRYDGTSLSEPRLDNSWWGASLQADIDFSGLTLTSITAYDDFVHGRYIDQDGLPEVHQEILYGSTILAWSQEFRLSNNSEGDLHWLIGINYAEDELDEDTLLFTELGVLKATLGGLTRSSQLYVQSTEALAVFGRTDWAFADKLNLVMEARYTKEEKSLVGGTYLPQANITLSFIDDSTSYDAISGKVGLEYSPTDDTLIYLSYSRGFKSGGYFGGFATNPAQLEPFDQETISAIELGFKKDWPEQALRLNGSAFYYDRQDVQANGIDTSGIVNIARLTNIGDVAVYGVELETVWAPTDQLTIQGGFAWLTSEIVSSDKVTGNLFGTSTTETFEGHRLPNQPEVSANIVVKYEDYLTTSLLGGLQVIYTYRGEQDLGMVLSDEAGALLTEDAYHLVNLKATIGPDHGKWMFAGYVENIFNAEYRTNAGGGAPGGFLEIYGAPRIFGISLDYNF